MNNPLDFFIVDNKNTPCLEGEKCKNSPSNCIRPKCNVCRLSPDAPYFIKEVYWKPLNKKFKHRILEEEKRHAKRQQAFAKQAAKKAKDPAKQARLRAAKRAERRTEKGIIKSTRNSGRVNKDGDHLLAGDIVIDTKLQSMAVNPVINLHELDKVREDANRNGKSCGCLAIHNKNGRVIIVLDQRDLHLFRQGN